MFRILVVDDQTIIREGTKAILLSLGELEVEMASNGLEALDLLQRKKIHLVITDIRMPDMDGIALMESASRYFPEIPFFVVSGYDDFAYAQKAIEYGAKAYLLKPLEREALLQAVNRILKEYRGKAAKSEADLNSGMTEQLAPFLRGNSSGNRMMEKIQREYPWLREEYQILLFGFPERELDGQERECGRRLFSAAAQYMPDGQYLVLSEEREFILIFRSYLNPDNLIQEGLTFFTGRVALSEVFRGVAQLPKAYAQVREVYVHHFLFPEKPLLREQDIAMLKKDFTVPYRQVERIRDIIGSCPDSDMVQYINRIFNRSVLSCYRIGYTLALCDSLYRNLRAMEALLTETGKGADSEIQKVNRLMEFSSMREYLLFLQKKVLHLHHLMREYKMAYWENTKMKEAISYIRKNYQKQLTLAMVSNEVSLNYAYFSNMFRKYAGKTFVEFLRDIRMEEGKRLLAETDHKVAQIAEMVGYDSYKSFSRVFKEEIGIAPAEYRKKQQILKQED